jgi:2,5-furandicarboxylate decarboxylase 1
MGRHCLLHRLVLDKEALGGGQDGKKAPLPTLRVRQHLRRSPIAVHSREMTNPRVKQEEPGMNVIEKPNAAARVATSDFDRFRLRRFIADLADTDELERREAPVDLADIAKILDGNPRAVHFLAAGPERQELVGNVVSSRSRIARAFSVAPERLAAEIARRLANKPQIVEVSRAEAPAQQVVLTDDADLTALPVHLQHGLDGAPYISASIDYAVDARTGWTNVGIRRLMLRGRRETGVDLVSPSDLRALYEASAAAGKPLPVSFVVGAHPIDHIAAMMRMPIDELGIVASLRDSPLAVVKGVTNDIRVPADAEMVLEGYFDARGHVEAEGPYGEFRGYYGAVKRNPVFHLTAITRRRDALFQTATIGGRAMSRTDTAVLTSVRTEVVIWKALEIAVREPVAVYATTSSGGNFNVRVALRQRVPGEARNAIAACMSALVNVKNVYVVDPDIDVTSDEQMDWAMATRFQPDRDLIVLSGMRTLPLDPSITSDRVGAKAGFDLTWPFGTGNRLETRVPEPPRFEGKRFASVAAALADGPKYFEQLMTAMGSRDGREIVRELEALRGRTALDRDGDGRYLVKPAGNG